LAKRWFLPDEVPPDVAEGLRSFAPAEQAILWRRGVASQSAADEFLRAPSSSHDPFAMLGMQQSVDRIGAALRRGESIAVYGDYDADGLTGTALLVQYLERMGARVRPFIPNRYREGYGLSEEALRALAAEGVELVVTVDCGARSLQEAAIARQIGLELVITDHHAPGAELPDAVALVNPKQPGDSYPFADLSGAGLAYKLTQAMAQALDGPDPEEQLDLVAIGTITDLVPLQDENRALARAGLEKLQATRRPGLKALMSVAGIQPASVKAASVGYAIGPRLNAAGRLDSAEAAYRLLITDSAEEAGKLAQTLEGLNRDRRQRTTELVELAREMADESGEEKLIFAAHPQFLEGIAGLVAARLVEERFRPVIIAHRGESETRGSGRSIPGFHITHALDECADLLIRYGGHAAAAGFTIGTADLQQLETRLHAIAARELAGTELTPSIEIDAMVRPEDLGWPLVEFCEALEPCGFGNESPLFGARGLQVLSVRAVGAEGRHLKLLMSSGPAGPPLDAIGFGMGKLAADLSGRVSIAFRLERNTYRGCDSMQLNLVDLVPGG
jgi:single-stranded-DNA-specific exonuclease